MGKEGIQIVTSVFIDDGVDEEDAPAIAKKYLENYRFIYARPDDDVSPKSLLSLSAQASISWQEDKGAFKSTFVSLSLAAHLKMTIGNIYIGGEGNRHPVGALAVAIAVVSRNLSLYEAASTLILS